MAATVGGIKAGRAFVLIEAVDKTAAVLKRVGGRMKAFAARMSDIGQSALRKGLTALLPAGLSLKVFADFDDSMRKVEARSAGTADEMRMLRDQVKELGRTTSFTASQVGELQGVLAQKGFRRSDLLDATPSVLALARAAGEGKDPLEDTANAADLVSGTIRAYGKNASDAANISDIFTVAVNNSNSTLKGLITSMSGAGPIAKDYNVSLEDTVATIAGMTNVNIDASSAGRAFRNMLLKLSDAAGRKGFNKNLKEMTGNVIDFTDESGNLRNLPQILFDIGEATKGLGTAKRGELLNQLFGLRAITPASALGKQENPFAGLVDKLQNAEGAAQETAKKMDAGIGGTFRKIMSAAEGVAIAIGETLEGAVSSLGDTFINMLGGLTEWIENNRELITLATSVAAGFVAVGGTLTALGLGINLIGSVLGGLGVILSGLSAAFAAIMSPVGLFVAAIAGGVAVLSRMGGVIGSTVGGAIDFLKDKFSGLFDTSKQVFGGILKLIGAGKFSEAGQLAWSALNAAWQVGMDKLLSLWDNFTVGIIDPFKEIGSTLKESMMAIWNTVVPIFKNLASTVGKIGGSLWKTLSALWDTGGTNLEKSTQETMSIGDIFIKTSFAIARAAINLWDGLKAAFAIGGSKVKQIFFTILEALAKAVADRLGGLLVKVGKAIQKSGLFMKQGRELVDIGEGFQRLDEMAAGKRQEAEQDLRKRLEEIGQDNLNKMEALNQQERAALESRDKEIKRREDERQKAIDDAQKDLDNNLAEVDKITAETEKKADEAAKEPVRAEQPEDQKPEEQPSEDAAKPAAVSPGVIKGLEAGSVEAIQQAMKNARQSQLDMMLAKQDEQIEETKKQTKAIKESKETEGV